MKRSIKMVCLLGTAGVLLGTYFLAGNLTKKSDVSEQDGTFALNDKAASDVTHLSWTANDTDFSFTRSDDSWSNDNDSTFPVDNDELNTLAETVTSISASRKLENVEDLSNYGLDQPAFSVAVKWSDGTETTYSVGSSTAFDDGYYMSDGTENTAYIVEDPPESAFDVTLLKLAQKEDIPQVDDPTQLTIGSEVNAVYRDESTSIDPDQHWYDTHSEDALTAEDVEELVTEAQGISWLDLVTVNATDDDLLNYGVDAGHIVNIGLGNANGDSMEIWIGGMNDDGDYYARLPDSKMVYTVASGSVEILLGASEANLRSTQVMHVDPENVKTAEFKDDSANRIFECSAAAAETAGESETSNEASEESTTSEDSTTSEETEDTAETTLTVTLNGEAFDSDTFKDLWSLVSSLAYTDKINEAPSGELLLTISCENTSGISKTLSIYTDNADSYIAVDENGNAVLISADDIDRIRRTVSQY